MSNKMFDIIFNLKFQAKELNRNARKCEKNEKVEKDKAFKAMQKNNMEGAQIHAANAIRLRNENLQFLRIASQLEGTVSKLEAQMSMLAMNKNIGKLTQQLQKTLSNNELLKASKVMEDFDKALENLELQGNNMSSVMNQQTAQATPQNQVQDLLSEIADSQGMALQEDLPGAPARLVEKQEEETLEARMKNLQGP